MWAEEEEEEEEEEGLYLRIELNPRVMTDCSAPGPQGGSRVIPLTIPYGWLLRYGQPPPHRV